MRSAAQRRLASPKAAEAKLKEGRMQTEVALLDSASKLKGSCSGVENGHRGAAALSFVFSEEARSLHG